MEAAVSTSEVASLLACMTGKSMSGGIAYGCGTVMSLAGMRAHLAGSCPSQ